MTKTQFRLGVLVIFAAILLNNLTSPSRYTIVDRPSQTALKIDGITGKTWVFRPIAQDWVWKETPHK